MDLPKARKLELKYGLTSLWVIEGHRGLWCECGLAYTDPQWTSLIADGRILLAGAGLRTPFSHQGTFFIRNLAAEENLQSGVEFSVSEEHNRDHDDDVRNTLSELRRIQIERESESVRKTEKYQRILSSTPPDKFSSYLEKYSKQRKNLAEIFKFKFQ